MATCAWWLPAVLALRVGRCADFSAPTASGFDRRAGVDTWLPGAGKIVRVPLQHLLPDVPRPGIVGTPTRVSR